MKSLRRERIVLTGAASGIGRALAKQLAAEGAKLCLVDRDESLLALLETELSSSDAIFLSIDIVAPDAASLICQRVVTRWGGIDLLINNAGVTHYGPTEGMTSQQLDHVLQVNLVAPLQLTRELLPHLLQSRTGHLVNIASMYGFVATPYCAAYHATKFGIIGFGKSLLAEYRDRLTITTVCPGFVTTSLFENGTSSLPDGKVPRPPEWMCTTPELAAKSIVRAIRNKQTFVLITWVATFLYYAKRFVPWLIPLAGKLAGVRHGK